MGHGHAHGHSHATARTDSKLTISTIATMAFVALELAAGIAADSLALISDAVHNFTDGIALVIALIAVKIERRPATQNRSFGFQRAGVLAAFINAGLLVAVTVFLFTEAWGRLRNPQAVDSTVMLVVAAIATLVNGAIMLWLRAEGKDDLNVRAAVVHMLGDALISAGVVVSAILIRVTGMTIFDPLATMAVGALILWTSFDILRETVNLLLEGTPRGIDPDAVLRDLSGVEGVFGVHHLHIWALAPSRPAMSCHIQLGDVSLKSTDETLSRVNDILLKRYGIVHSTVQFEHAGCPVDDPFCLRSVPEPFGERRVGERRRSEG